MMINGLLTCPKCKNDNGGMIEQANHRREQMDCYCNICAYSWIEYFSGVPKENVIPPATFKEGSPSHHGFTMIKTDK